MQPGPQRFAAMMLTVICANNDTINAYVFLNMMLFTKEHNFFPDVLRQDITLQDSY